MAVTTAHMQDSVSPLIPRFGQSFFAKSVDKSLKVIKIAKSSREDGVFNLFVGWFFAGHVYCVVPKGIEKLRS